MRITPLENWIKQKIRGPDAGPLRLSRKEIEEYQLGKLKETISWARSRSPFYQKHLRAVEIHALDDMNRVPFTNALDLKQQAARLVCVSQNEINRVVTLQSSGTSGEPKRIFFTGGDQELTLDFFSRGMSTMVGAGDRVLILLPGQLPGSVGDLLSAALHRLGVESIPHGPVTDARATLRLVFEQNITALVGIPVQVLGLARCGDSNFNRRPPVQNVLLTTDHVPYAIKKTLRHKWGCRVFSHYGMTEMGLGGGVECAALTGYHLREADLYFEIVDPVTGAPVPEGETGEVVFTTLTRRGMPLIRYQTGDLAGFIPEPCPCGTILTRLAPVRERLAGRVLLGDEYLSMAELDEALFALPDLLDFRAVIRAGNLLQLEIKTRQKTLPPDVVRAVKHAVECSDVVRRIRQKKIKLDLNILEWQDISYNATAKRVITNKREPVIN
jgi:phenylacetate-coenzyme A ligase PaaK-like adenylate-forming protein